LFTSLAAGSVAAGIVGGAIVGAVVGGVLAAVQGKNILKGIVTGGLIGGAIGGVAAAVAPSLGMTVTPTASLSGAGPVMANPGSLTTVGGSGTLSAGGTFVPSATPMLTVSPEFAATAGAAGTAGTAGTAGVSGPAGTFLGGGVGAGAGGLTTNQAMMLMAGSQGLTGLVQGLGQKEPETVDQTVTPVATVKLPEIKNVTTTMSYRLSTPGTQVQVQTPGTPTNAVPVTPTVVAQNTPAIPGGARA